MEKDSGESVALAEADNSLPMARVTQRYLVKEDEDGNVGDCMRACVASITGLPEDDVPHFALYGYEDAAVGIQRHGWWWALIGFMDTLEPSYVTLVPDAHPEPSESVDDIYGCYIASGKSPRGDWQHCVIARGGEVIWDPHPSRAGIDGPLEVMAYFVRRASLSGSSAESQ